MSQEQELNQLDTVELITSKRVTYLSDLPGSLPEPHGHWTVAGFIDGDVLMTRGTATIRAPITDVKVVANFELDQVITALDRESYGRWKENTERRNPA